MSDAIRTAAIASARHALRSKLLWTALVLLLLYTVGGFFIAPALMQRYLPSLVEDRLVSAPRWQTSVSIPLP